MRRTLMLDDLTPLSAYAALRHAFGDRATFLLESAPTASERWGRYSMIGVRPRRALTLDLSTDAGVTSARLVVRDLATGAVTTDTTAAPARALELLRAATQIDGPTIAHADTPRVVDGAVGYVAYDMVHALEPVAPWPTRRRLAHLFDGASYVVFDARFQSVSLYGDDAATLDAIEAALRSPFRRLRALPMPDRSKRPASIDVGLSDADYEARVRRAQEYIGAGDIFQVVLARTFTAPRLAADPFDAYRALRALNPSPYLYYVDLPRAFEDDALSPVAIAGASPETLVRLEDGVVTVRPLAGTRPRGADEATDRAHEADLRADPKEIAEHVMLVDLGRNDVGRVAKTGSVRVPTKLAVEKYSHVMHLVSEVTGQLRDDRDAWDVLAAAFPAGTLSGAPKVRAMQIIRELEAGPRGVYGGAVGYVSRHGTMDLAIAIRTLVAWPDRFEVGAGAGVVEASVPSLEAQETRHKAGAALSAAAAAIAAAGG